MIEKIVHAIESDSTRDDRKMQMLVGEQGSVILTLVSGVNRTNLGLTREAFQELWAMMNEVGARPDLYAYKGQEVMASGDGKIMLTKFQEVDLGTVEGPGDDLFTEQEFREYHEEGGIISSDGTGYWATATHYSWAFPIFEYGQITQKPDWATHVVWFNK